MRFVFLAVRVYPFWAIPMAAIFWQLARLFRRREYGWHGWFYGITLFFLLTAAVWVWFRGDLNSDRWVQSFVQEPS